ncbi:MAG: hypothetical protein IPH18_10950 [Chitinophagaceae bacterium]|nr:hypothetical protein [Chitinophagaceae bacterium]
MLRRFYNSSKNKYITGSGRNKYAVINDSGISILPSGRFVTPAGQTIRITHDPFGMAISPNGKTAVTLHNGVFTIIQLLTLRSVRVPSYNQELILTA